MTIKITWLGTAAYILEIDGSKLLFDPFFARNEKSNPILLTKREKVKDIKAIFISHGHFDHITDAAWFAENLNVKVYCSETAKNNMIKLAQGEVIDSLSFPLTDKGKNNVIPCNYSDNIKITNEISVEFIKSEHIKFDLNTILTRLFSWKFLKQARTMAKYGRGFAAGQVFAFCTYYKKLRIISFGSLWHQYTDILEKYQNCDIFLVPVAGNSKKNLAIKTGKMVEVLKPKVVIPIHWDDFFPPISRLENLQPFYTLMEQKFPQIKVVTLTMDEDTLIPLN